MVKFRRAFALSDREVEIALMMYEGFTNRQISAALKLTEGTTRNYVSSIYEKTHSENRADAIRASAYHPTQQGLTVVTISEELQISCRGFPALR